MLEHTLCPKLYSPQSKAKRFLLRYKFQDLVRHTSPVERSHFLVIQSSQVVIVFKVEVEGNGREYQACKNQIETDTRKFQFDDRHKRVRNRSHLFDSARRGHTFQDRWEVGKEVIDKNMFRRDDQGVDIRSCLF